MSRACGRCRLSENSRTLVASQSAETLSVAPMSPNCAAISSGERLAVPSSHTAAVMSASPGVFGRRWPGRRERRRAGSPPATSCFSTSSTCMPLASLARWMGGSANFGSAPPSGSDSRPSSRHTPCAVRLARWRLPHPLPLSRKARGVPWPSVRGPRPRQATGSARSSPALPGSTSTTTRPGPRYCLAIFCTAAASTCG